MHWPEANWNKRVNRYTPAKTTVSSQIGFSSKGIRINNTQKWSKLHAFLDSIFAILLAKIPTLYSHLHVPCPRAYPLGQIANYMYHHSWWTPTRTQAPILWGIMEEWLYKCDRATWFTINVYGGFRQVHHEFIASDQGGLYSFGTVWE